MNPHDMVLAPRITAGSTTRLETLARDASQIAKVGAVAAVVGQAGSRSEDFGRDFRFHLFRAPPLSRTNAPLSTDEGHFKALLVVSLHQVEKLRH